ncbi:MAG: hypothetical protein KAT70_10030 [Thermoplasmata archaeon]|nr:hypothetical protein [Thermoplasmata archaeon]
MTWETCITNVGPDKLAISGYMLEELVARKTLLETTHLLVNRELPSETVLEEMSVIAHKAVAIPAPAVAGGEEVSKTLSTYLLMDQDLAAYSEGRKECRVAFCLGRMVRYMARIYGNEAALDRTEEREFSSLIYLGMVGGKLDNKRARLLEAMVVACVDHGVTPPSAQATLIAASTRAAYEVCVAHGIGVITDVHGGAGTKAARFFGNCVEKAEDVGLEEALRQTIHEYSEAKKRIAGLGHRVHKNDPRRDVLWLMAKEAGVSGKHVEASKMITNIFREIKGKDLPINVDGVIGAIVADMGMDVTQAKAVFIMGRTAGLSAHYFEEVSVQPRMRRIVFADAVYKGKEDRPLP